MNDPELEQLTREARYALDVWTGVVEDAANDEDFRMPPRLAYVDIRGPIERDALEDLTIQLHEMPWAAMVLATEQPVQKGA